MATEPAKLQVVVEVWKKVVDVQQHFNDIALRIRNYALTLFTAILAGIGLLEKNQLHLKIWILDIPTSSILCFFGLLVMWGFYYMDKYWYHRLLVGAVKQGLAIENKYAVEFAELGLTTAIGKESPHKALFSFKKKANRKDIHSNEKFRTFYYPLLISLLALFFATAFFSTNSDETSKEAVKSYHQVTQIDSTLNSQIKNNKLVTDSTVTIFNRHETRVDSTIVPDSKASSKKASPK